LRAAGILGLDRGHVEVVTIVAQAEIGTLDQRARRVLLCRLVGRAELARRQHQWVSLAAPSDARRFSR